MNFYTVCDDRWDYSRWSASPTFIYYAYLLSSTYHENPFRLHFALFFWSGDGPGSERDKKRACNRGHACAIPEGLVSERNVCSGSNFLQRWKSGKRGNVVRSCERSRR